MKNKRLTLTNKERLFLTTFLDMCEIHDILEEEETGEPREGYTKEGLRVYRGLIKKLYKNVRREGPEPISAELFYEFG